MPLSIILRENTKKTKLNKYLERVCLPSMTLPNLIPNFDRSSHILCACVCASQHEGEKRECMSDGESARKGEGAKERVCVSLRGRRRKGESANKRE